MSLINEALKKAQKQRTGEAPPLASMPAIGGESPRQISRRAKPASFKTLLVRLGLVAAGLVIVLVGGLLYLNPARTPAPAESAAPVTASPNPAPTLSGSEPAPAAPTETVFVLPVAPPPAPPQATPVAVQPPPKNEPAPSPAQVTRPTPSKVEPAPLPSAAPSARLEPRAIAYIDNLRVAGIRASATDSKVLMNDRVYRIGDTVEHEMGLKLVGITSSSLTFEDLAGGRYTRNF